jgi:hypothetical protein
VWLDNWSINPGDSIVKRINEGLEEADYVLICYSSEDTTSPWMSREWMSTLARQLEGREVKLIPVVLTGKRIPGILYDVKHADLLSDWSTGLTQLLRVIK